MKEKMRVSAKPEIPCTECKLVSRKEWWAVVKAKAPGSGDDFDEFRPMSKSPNPLWNGPIEATTNGTASQPHLRIVTLNRHISK